mmetsp:Transcript_73687/g.206871  ORF Transcript_73687/g.206871 Transcript_73687/m.206871 type:complete len:204 (+) Transcript_73687:734-1345(+)
MDLRLSGLRARDGAEHPRDRQPHDGRVDRRAQLAHRARRGGGLVPWQVPRDAEGLHRHHQQHGLVRARVRGPGGHRRLGAVPPLRLGLARGSHLRGHGRLPARHAGALRAPAPRVHPQAAGAAAGQLRLLWAQPLRDVLDPEQSVQPRRDVDVCHRRRPRPPCRSILMVAWCWLGPPKTRELGQPAVRESAHHHDRGRLVCTC